MCIKIIQKLCYQNFHWEDCQKQKIYQSNPDLAKVIVDDDEIDIVEIEKPNENINVPSFDNIVEKPVEVEKPNVEIIPEQTQFENFEDEELSVDEMEQIVAEVEKTEKGRKNQLKLKKPKELETKSVWYSTWKNELEKNWGMGIS